MPEVTGESDTTRVVVVMGVSGSGKSTVGRLLAERLGSAFQEGDDLHPPANVAKMRTGVPLTDDDRRPWLDRVACWVGSRLDAGEGGVVTCSALRRAYRERIAARGGVVFVHLTAEAAVLERRLRSRRGHYMSAVLLASQLAALEEPGPDEPVLRVPTGAAPEAVVDEVLERLEGTYGVPLQG